MSLNRLPFYLATTALAALCAPALAQESADGSLAQLEEIIVTAQRQAQSLQDVPIAVSAFGAEELDKSGTQGLSDLQFALPNVTFTKGNFTGSSFQIRGVGSNAVGTTADDSTGIHVNDVPIGGARIFETEFYDVERVEVLRGPQGTQFGRSSTGGTVNMLTRRPDFEMGGNAELELSNYKGVKIKGVLNVPLSDTFAARIAGIYLNRDGFTKNLFNNENIDGRDQYSVRGSLRWQPSPDTTIDFMASTFRENSDRSRIQKQVCNRDVTGIYGCLPNTLEFETVNANSTIQSIATSVQFLQVAAPAFGALIPALALSNLAGADAFAGVVNPADYRTVRVDFAPQYKSREDIFQLALRHDFDTFNIKLNAGYTDNGVDSLTDFNLATTNNIVIPAALQNPAIAGPLAPAIAQFRNALFRGNDICVSAVDTSFAGFIGGKVAQCGPNTSEYDRSFARTKQYSIEGIVASALDGPLNGQLGVSYSRAKNRNLYFVASSGLDYAAGLLGLATGQALAAPFFANETDEYILKSKAIFGELTYEFSDTVSVIAGIRYTEDDKSVVSRGALLNFPISYGTTDARPNFAAVTAGAGVRTATGACVYDADSSSPGNAGNVGVAGTCNEYSLDEASFKKATGRLVFNWKPELSFTDDTLIYASASRGYKGGGLNPPFDAVLFPSQSKTFRPETIYAYEIGTKNRFGGGLFQANLTGFYYDYKDMQISNIVNRTSFNTNIDATIYGVEAEFLARATENLTIGANASYMKSKIANGASVLDPANITAGRSDVLVIKDLTNAAQCAVTPTTAGANVRTILQQVGGTLTGAGTLLGNAQLLQVGGAATAAGATAFPIPELNHFGNFGVCQALTGAAAAYRQVTTLAPGFAVSDGIATDLSGNELQNSPRYKLSASIDYDYPLENGMRINARIDYSWQGKFYGTLYNRPSDRLPSYDLINARLSLSGPDDRWTFTAFVENLENDAAATGLFVSDQSVGLVRNIFTTEPRRFGVSAGLKF